jgi:hypothetical protein
MELRTLANSTLFVLDHDLHSVNHYALLVQHMFGKYQETQANHQGLQNRKRQHQ